ncbi:hypothetical protein [Nocardia wallacei]|uniref:hypothetical protein n=1 Tax=Nocardia wallacei TaxID=480035 RepID=UPI00245847E4|nr:hypothetical protein [Nocardia wallacei]
MPADSRSDQHVDGVHASSDGHVRSTGGLSAFSVAGSVAAALPAESDGLYAGVSGDEW